MSLPSRLITYSPWLHSMNSSASPRCPTLRQTGRLGIKSAYEAGSGGQILGEKRGRGPANDGPVPGTVSRVPSRGHNLHGSSICALSRGRILHGRSTRAPSRSRNLHGRSTCAPSRGHNLHRRSTCAPSICRNLHGNSICGPSRDRRFEGLGPRVWTLRRCGQVRLRRFPGEGGLAQASTPAQLCTEAALAGPPLP